MTGNGLYIHYIPPIKMVMTGGWFILYTWVPQFSETSACGWHRFRFLIRRWNPQGFWIGWNSLELASMFDLLVWKNNKQTRIPFSTSYFQWRPGFFYFWCSNPHRIPSLVLNRGLQVSEQARGPWDRWAWIQKDLQAMQGIPEES